MLDDIRNHDPIATEKERGWMNTSPVEMGVCIVILTSVSIAIGVAASSSFDMEPHRPSVAAHASR
jgi:hypothetical protein